MPQEITAETLKKTFGEKLTLLRKESEETIEEAAFDLGLDPGDYFKFLKGKRLPHILTLMRISQKYSVSLDWWFGELKNVPKNKAQIRQYSLENQVSRIVHNLDNRLQKAALSMLKASVKNLVNVSR
ncbi:MAG: helix-turn-helix domain-containing protein [Candidatus Margulisbacteria bacterium]|jgi:transcriptional regulator with XRE-family HTH domain|nr:helix-turn-helix domain-containing protein [Candidatus Margulisiibacteriota bacterium]